MLKINLVLKELSLNENKIDSIGANAIFEAAKTRKIKIILSMSNLNRSELCK